ncbi:diacylglycerol kinase catalytic domain-containing protein [Ditylenchus destructor]|uniref:Diacylglycerol kinase catalytic domain-containing protein n=1 Tax=Ditylenchus destructor TaxID=166010 RepID=A0AAD4NKA3_9BILA|nr:diacylglycerol kinase catalytic domain-containing protein [Ditylenchus destructor]
MECSTFCGRCSSSKVGNEQPKVSYPPDISNGGNLLIFVNPNSGAGVGLKVFRSQVRELLEKRRIGYELILTVIISGDGLVFEALNALALREDNLLSTIPIAIIPCGSGNGLLASVCYARGLPLNMPLFLDTAINVLCSCNAISIPMNFIHVQTPVQHFGSFLSIGWGMLADIDIESEKLRRLCGSNRFVFSTIVRLLNIRTYCGTLSYLEAPVESDEASHNPDICGQATVYNKVNRTSAASPKTVDADISLKGNSNNSMLSGKAWTTNTDVCSLKEAVPSNWQVVKGDFVFVYAVSLSHISNQGHYMPNARHNLNRIWLTYALAQDIPRGHIHRRLDLLKFLKGIESGTHLEAEWCRTVPVTAFRLETNEDNARNNNLSNGRIVVDGEVIDCNRIQADVASSKIFRVVTRQ